MMTRILIALALSILQLGGASAHEWYSGLRSPQGVDCCGGRDCQPLGEGQVRLNQETGEIEVLIGSTWFKAEDPNWYLGPSPDGSWHACLPPGRTMPICVWGSMGA